MTELNGDSIREAERASIRGFLEGVRFTGNVLDLGCGKQPYRELVELLGAEYHGFDRAEFPGNVSVVDVGFGDPFVAGRWDAVLCTQVIQYVQQPYPFLRMIRDLLRPAGALVLTGPTNWAEVEPADLHRFTLSGIGRILADAGYQVERLERRAALDFPGFSLSLGWGAVARA